MTHAQLGRRELMAGGAVAASALVVASCARGKEADPVGQATSGEKGASVSGAPLADAIVPFDGEHQAGVQTPSQAHVNLVGFNLKDGAGQRGARNLMRLWTEDARALCTAETPRGSLEPEMTQTPANLTVTCGWGASFFAKIGAQKPEWLGDVRAYSRD